jgi:hypothetical protein
MEDYHYYRFGENALVESYYSQSVGLTLPQPTPPTDHHWLCLTLLSLTYIFFFPSEHPFPFLAWRG